MNNVKTLKILLAAAVVLLCACTGLCIFLYVNNNRAIPAAVQENESTAVCYTRQQLEAQIEEALKDYQESWSNKLKTHFENGNSTASYLRQQFPDKVVYYDNKSKSYIFGKISSKLPANTLSVQNFKKDEDTGKLEYLKDGKTVSQWGIDVSRYQGKINWTKVKQSGIDFAILRLGYRAYGSGQIIEDISFKENIEGALKNEISCGVYFFTQAITAQEAREEAQYMIDILNRYAVTEPVIIDVEPILGDTYRAEDLTPQEQTEIIKAFCSTIAAAGYTPMIYANLSTYMSSMDLDQLSEYKLWYAFYEDELYFPYEIDMWQYTDTGSIDGIEGNVDLNIKFTKKDISGNE